MKLGKRLTQLVQHVKRDYDHIWDCCCDHGLLGAALLKQYPSSTVHFVDIVPSLIEKVTRDLTRYFPATTDSPRWRTYCLDVRDLPLEANAGSHLVIIAGVGGDLMTEFIAELAKRHPSMTFDLLLCPVHHTYTLREQLIALNAELKCELLVEENQRIYELLHVQISPSSEACSHPLSLVGESLWQVSGPDQSKIAQRYLQQLQQHYQRKAQGGDAGAKQRWQAYQAVEILHSMDATLELAQ
ncbi:tRNA (adenine(22)-N(1))-methyltransferase [Vibrio cholerae]|uniref:tRNA (adenine(22)-N(1))-methyltransferase n=1 Tax=Vibrio cholerae TaxID=666 RepID=UPI002935EE3F|nr:tRNA (adenine(22)-N(1))-methyltransferase TrmK [Vibrio cholerae]MDW4532953.1 tRNA (adenine(22)-N(1))-methyltransferase TrmK [Vibrio cholerae]